VARTIPAALTPVDPSTLLTGEPLKATTVAALGAAVNWSLAHVARAPVIAQAWAETAGSVPCARTSPVPAPVGRCGVLSLGYGPVGQRRGLFHGQCDERSRRDMEGLHGDARCRVDSLAGDRPTKARGGD
jgi:hypothetical protein